MLQLRRRIIDKINYFRHRNHVEDPPNFFESVEMPEKIRNSYCPLPFMHVSVGPNEAMRVCCNSGADGDIQTPQGERYYFSQVKSVKDYYNNSSLTRIRRQMLDGKRPTECSRCYLHEDTGGYSIRQGFVVGYSRLLDQHLKNTTTDGKTPPEIKYVDFALGNNCNIKCRMCNPTNSKLLEKEFSQIFKDQSPDYYSYEEFEKASKAWTDESHYKKILSELGETVEKVLMTGGEPFVIKAQYDILDQLIESGRSQKIELTYHTNLTVLPSQLIEKWKKFRKVYVYGSVDGFGEVNDIVRAPARWKKVDQNLRRLIDLRKEINLHIEVHTVYQAYTISRMTELLEYLQEFKNDMPCLPYFNYLHIPFQLKANVLPRPIREKAVKQMQDFLDKHRAVYQNPDSFFTMNTRHLKVLEGHLKLTLDVDEENHYSQFLDFNHKMDQVRNEKLSKVLPEIFLEN